MEKKEAAHETKEGKWKNLHHKTHLFGLYTQKCLWSQGEKLISKEVNGTKKRNETYNFEFFTLNLVYRR